MYLSNASGCIQIPAQVDPEFRAPKVQSSCPEIPSTMSIILFTYHETFVIFLASFCGLFHWDKAAHMVEMIGEVNIFSSG